MKARFLVFITLLLGCALASVAASLKVSVIDVGQADSILVQFSTGQTMLVDAGNKADGPAVVKYLKDQGVKRIDVLVASHPHEDHIGGMPAVFTAFPIGKVWDSGFNQGSQTQQQFLAAVKKEKCQYGKPKKGFTADIGKVKIQVLAPGPNFITDTNSDANNNSLVLRLVYDQVSVLLAGDMETEEREALGPWPASTVLKVAHHGSENGTDADFSKAVAPQFAIVSYGENNYGHPHSIAIDALTAVGAKLFSTKQNGTVVITSDGKKATVKGLGKASKKANAAAVSNGSTSAGGGGGDTVYITRTGEKYHRAGCRYLARSCIPISRADAIAQGYEPCKVCQP